MRRKTVGSAVVFLLFCKAALLRAIHLLKRHLPLVHCSLSYSICSSWLGLDRPVVPSFQVQKVACTIIPDYSMGMCQATAVQHCVKVVRVIHFSNISNFYFTVTYFFHIQCTRICDSVPSLDNDFDISQENTSTCSSLVVFE